MIKLSYGNPTNDLIPYLKEPTYLDSLLQELKNTPYPEDNSKETIQEIQNLLGYVNELKNDPASLSRYTMYDTNYENYIIDCLVKQGINKEEVTNLIRDIRQDTLPLLLRVKFHHQRPRPYQLAYYFNSDLHPYKSYTSNSPSYPSGHAFQSKVYTQVLGNRYPKYSKALNELSLDIAASRIFMGLHYPSDNNFAFYMAELVVNHPDFKRKYKI